jgi:hypothetical protein
MLAGATGDTKYILIPPGENVVRLPSIGGKRVI